MIYDIKDLNAALNNSQEFLQALNQIKQREPAEIAYTQGATIGALAHGQYSSALPPEISYYIASFLNQTDGSNLAQTNIAAHTLAAIEKSNVSTPQHSTLRFFVKAEKVRSYANADCLVQPSSQASSRP
jgi:hypothetical protein